MLEISKCRQQLVRDTAHVTGLEITLISQSSDISYDCSQQRSAINGGASFHVPSLVRLFLANKNCCCCS